MANLNSPPITSIQESRKQLKIVLSSFGIKSGQPFPSADLYLDCRGVADPSHFIPGTGDGVAVQKWVETHSNVGTYYDVLRGHLNRLTTRRGVGHEYDKPFHVVCMCAHGIHRSRAVKHILAGMLKGVGFCQVEVQ